MSNNYFMNTLKDVMNLHLNINGLYKSFALILPSHTRSLWEFVHCVTSISFPKLNNPNIFK
jgi:hypothetical protein